MFNKLIGSLPYSPGMVDQVGSFINKLKKEEAVRKSGLIFIVLSLLLQIFVTVNPPPPAIAANGNNIIYNGVASKEDLLNKYDANSDGAGHNDIRQIFDHYGISRDNLVNAVETTLKSTDHQKQLRSIGRKSYGLEGETAIPISGTSTTVYERYLWSWDSAENSTYKVIQGTTDDGRFFAVILSCGNIVIDQPLPSPQSPVGYTDADCDSISGWAYDPNDKNAHVNILAYIRLADDQSKFHKQIVTANLPGSDSDVSGNHFFVIPIPDEMKSDSVKTIYTIVALDTVGGGDNTYLAQGETIQTYCKQSTDKQPEAVVPVTSEGTETAISCDLNPSLRSDDALCQPCPYNNSIWLEDTQCIEEFSLVAYSKTASNLTQEIADANNTTAKPGDEITYTLKATNLGNTEAKASFQDDLSDIIEYASLVDSDGGLFDYNTGLISWEDINLEPNSTVEKTIKIKVFDQIPATPSPINNPESYNLEMRNTFHGHTIAIKLPTPISKTPEVLAAELPNTGPGLNTSLGILFIFTSSYFYYRNKELQKELRLAKAEIGYGI